MLFRTRTGELSVRVESLRLLVKSLRPLPDKWHGIADTEVRYRQRYVDLIMTEASRKVFTQRTQLVRFLRDMLDALGFMEVETPMMQPIPGGAAARPFVTHHNALDIDMYLRIAPELYLKRLVVGGFERVYEINRNFRNEGLSTRHNPEFTMLELYQSYADYEDLMNLVEAMLRGAAEAVVGSLSFDSQGRRYDLAPSFRRVTVEDLILEQNADLDRARLRDVAYLRAACDARGIPWKPGDGAGKLQIEIFEKTGEHTLLDPTFVYAYPAEVSPLSRANDADRSWSTGSSSSSAAANSPMVSPSSTMPRTRRRASARRSSARSPATRRRCSTTPTTCARSNTACRRRPGSVSASTGSRCS